MLSEIFKTIIFEISILCECFIFISFIKSVREGRELKMKKQCCITSTQFSHILYFFFFSFKVKKYTCYALLLLATSFWYVTFMMSTLFSLDIAKL